MAWEDFFRAEQDKMRASEGPSLTGTQRGLREADPVVPFGSGMYGQIIADPEYRPGDRGPGFTTTGVQGLPKVYSARTVGEARGAYYNDPMSTAVIEEAARFYYRDNPSFTYQWTKNFFEDIVTQAATEGGVSIGAVLTNILNGTIRSGKPGGGSDTDTSGGGGGGGTTTAYNFTNPREARAIIDASLKEYLGRAATEDEISKFAAALRAEEQANPTVVTYSGGVQTRTEGADAQLFARDYAAQQEGFAEYQVATKYLDLFLGALD